MLPRLPEKLAHDLKMPVHTPDEVLRIPAHAAFEAGITWRDGDYGWIGLYSKGYFASAVC